MGVGYNLKTKEEACLDPEGQQWLLCSDLPFPASVSLCHCSP